MSSKMQNIYFCQESWDALQRLNGASTSKKVRTAIIEHEKVVESLLQLDANRLRVQNLEKCIRAYCKYHQIDADTMYDTFGGVV